MDTHTDEDRAYFVAIIEYLDRCGATLLQIAAVTDLSTVEVERILLRAPSPTIH